MGISRAEDTNLSGSGTSLPVTTDGQVASAAEWVFAKIDRTVFPFLLALRSSSQTLVLGSKVPSYIAPSTGPVADDRAVTANPERSWTAMNGAILESSVAIEVEEPGY